MLVFQIVAMCLCAVLAVLYLIESFRDDLDVQSSNQAAPNATKGLRACVTPTRRIGLSYLVMFLALLAETIVDSLVLSCVVLAVVIAMVIIVYRETNALREHKRTALLDDIDRHGEQLEQR